jgi:hypothetical protein
MNITFTVSETDGTGEAYKDTHYLLDGDVLVIMARRDESGTLVVDHFEPLEVDNHPDTLRGIGGRIVSFTEGK